jgi:hypothetical protein
MSSTRKVSAMTAATSVAGADVFPIVQGGVNKKVTFTALFAAVPVPILFPNGTSGAPSIGFSSEATLGFFRVSAGNIGITGGLSFGDATTFWKKTSANGIGLESVGSTWGEFVQGGIISYGGFYARSNSGTYQLGTSNDVVLNRDAADILALRRGTNLQSFRVYGSYTDASNNTRLDINHSSGLCEIATYGVGTGSSGLNLYIGTVGPGDLIFETSNSGRWSIKSTTGHLFAQTDNVYDIGAGAANRPRNIYVGGSVTVANQLILGGNGDHIVNSGSSGALELVAWASGGAPICLTGTRITFSGLSASFPSVKRASASLQVRLADDSAFTFIQGKLQTDANAVTETITPTKTLTLYDASGTAYKVPCV